MRTILRGFAQKSVRFSDWLKFQIQNQRRIQTKEIAVVGADGQKDEKKSGGGQGGHKGGSNSNAIFVMRRAILKTNVGRIFLTKRHSGFIGKINKEKAGNKTGGVEVLVT